MKIVLETERLLLRHFTEADADALLIMESDPDVLRYVGRKPLADVDAYRNKIKSMFLPYYNKPGGYGGLDIYMSTKDAKGEWGKAFNVGGMINTKGNDDSPYIHHDGTTLYFSSDGHAVIGNNDIFVSEFKNGKWTKAENLGYPINSWE